MDQAIKRILKNETERQESTVELIASENFASEAVMELAGSVFTNKYAEGYPEKRYYNGCENMDDIENLAIKRYALYMVLTLRMFNHIVVLTQTLLYIKHS